MILYKNNIIILIIRNKIKRIIKIKMEIIYKISNNNNSNKISKIVI